MKAYYIHWSYPAIADDAYFYGGEDDDKLFHKKENAEKYMEKKLQEFRLAEEFGDYPNSGIVCERDIVFED